MLTQSLKVTRLCICLCAIGAQIPTYAGAQHTAADDVAYAEVLKAKEEIAFIRRTFQDEAKRLTSFPDEPPSSAVAELSDSSAVKRPKLGDASVPLHLRLAERERLAFVSGIKMIKASLRGQCPKPVVDATTFSDPVVRSQELQRIQCQRTRRELYQRGTHNEGVAQEKSILELRLPPYTEAEMLSRQRAANKLQDAELAATFEGAEAVDGAIEKFLDFLDAHAQGMRFSNGQFLFSNAADAAAFNDLQNNVLIMQSQDNHQPQNE